MKKISSLFLSVLLILSLCLSASAAHIATIDRSRTGSLTLYKYDLTSAEANGLTDTVYLSTGREDSNAAAAFAPYAIPGVEFTCLRVGGIETYYSTTNGLDGTVQVVYGVEDKALLDAVGLTSDDKAMTFEGMDYYASDVLIHALSDSLTSNNTSTKDKLEAFIARSEQAKVMPLTDETGKTGADDLELGLYLVVETKVPENVTYTVDPFLVSVPMTDIQTGDQWFYDVTVYPKNQTGNPTLDKEISNVESGYSDVTTVSDNELVNYRILSTLPSIHSSATYLSQYEFVDTLTKGAEFNQEDVKICWYKDRSVAEKDYTIAAVGSDGENGSAADAVWAYGSEFFRVTYGQAANDAATMKVTITDQGLAELNQPAGEKDQQGKYSGWTMVIYYNATVNSNADVTYGDSGNPNDVTLTWSRTTEGFYDTLTDEAKFYTYGIDLTKVLSEGGTAYTDVAFTLENQSNATGAHYLLAEAAQPGLYYITGNTSEESEATRFSPDSNGKLKICGLEADTYELLEVKTASGYTLLKDPISIVITADYTANDPSGALTANSTVDGNEVQMNSDGDSANALVPLTVLNTRGFDLPKTGGTGTLVTTVCGVMLAGVMITLAVMTVRRRKNT